MDSSLKRNLLVRLYVLESVAGQLSRLYEEHPELNEQVDIQTIIPMSLDEWESEIRAKVDQIESGG